MTTAMGSPRYAEWDGLDYWKFQAVETPGGNVRLWYLSPGETVWQIGHAVTTSDRQSFDAVTDLMRLFTTGRVSRDEYNARLVVA